MRPRPEILIVLLVAGIFFPGLLGAQGAPKLAAKALTKDQAENLIRHAILAKKFKGGDVRELMLSEPERSGSGFTYNGEFTVRHAGKTIHCEDWRFVLQEKISGWMTDETRPGRCND